MRLNKVNKLSNGQFLFAHWANNRGRGRNNCTLTIALHENDRHALSSKITNVIRQVRTSSWEGDVNVSQAVLRELGIKKGDISTGKIRRALGEVVE